MSTIAGAGADTSHISKSSLSCAKSFLSKKKYGRSFANFLLFIKLSPHKKEEILDDFINCMTEWTNQLISEERVDDLFKCYDQACEVLPDCESVLNNIGAQLFRYSTLSAPLSAQKYKNKVCR